MKLIVCAVLAVVFCVHEAVAQPVNTVSNVVLADVRTQLNWYASINPDCSSAGATIIKIRKEPRRGKLEIVEESGFPYYPTANVRSACNRTQVPMTKVFYTADADYAGKDTVELEVFFPSGSARKCQ